MADYDVGAVSLSVPPVSAVLQQYRPAVLVKNNGVHDALAVGSLRIYDSATGLLIFTTEIYSGTIAPGETEPAQAVDYWTPPALGAYQVIAYVTCINDQYEPNNSLPPTIIHVTAAPPPPPPPVQAHAAQHEDGGLDEINADGLHGKLSDAQTPLAHKLSHQAAGSDQLNVTGLPGVLADGQPIAAHHSSHAHDGNDEIWVGGLHGELADNQPAKVHDNAKHDPNYTTVTEFNNHLSDTTDVHAVATNLEQLAHKEQANGYPGLDETARIARPRLGQVPMLPDAGLAPRYDGNWGQARPSDHHERHETDGGDELDGYERTANKEQANGYPGLDETTRIARARLAQVPLNPTDDMVPRHDGNWGSGAPAAHAASHALAGLDPLDLSTSFLTAKGGLLTINAGETPADIALLEISVPFLHENQAVKLQVHGLITTPLEPGNIFGFYLKSGASNVAQIATFLEVDHTYLVEIEGIIHACSATQLSGTLTVNLLRDDGTSTYLAKPVTVPFAIPVTATWMKLVFDLGASPPGTKLDRYSYFARTEAPPTA